jgi:hypothetical protein
MTSQHPRHRGCVQTQMYAIQSDSPDARKRLHESNPTTVTDDA